MDQGLQKNIESVKFKHFLGLSRAKGNTVHRLAITSAHSVKALLCEEQPSKNYRRTKNSVLRSVMCPMIY